MARSKNKLKAEEKNKQIVNEYEEHIEQQGGLKKEDKKKKRRRRWRRFFIFLGSFVLSIVLIMFIFIFPIGKDGLQYHLTINDDTDTILEYAVIGYYGKSKEIDIPKRHLFIPVTVINWNNIKCVNDVVSITIPDSVTRISFSSYGIYDLDYSSLKNIYITDIAAWCNISSSDKQNPLYYADNLYLNGELVTDLVIPNGVTKINNHAFHNYSRLTSITIPDSVTSIGSFSFSGCSNLTSITIPDSVTSIGSSAFSGCSGIIEIEKNGVSYVDKWVIDCDTSLESVVLRENTVGIADYAFSHCSSLTSITIPDSVINIGSAPFGSCRSLVSISVGDNNGYYKSIDGNLYTKDGKTLIQYAVGKTNLEFLIQNSVTRIGGGAFYGCTSLKSITITDSVTSIGSSAFEDCTSLESITIPDSVTSIGDYAFDGCSSLTSITIPDSVTSIGYGAFVGCLTDVYYTGSPKDWYKIDIESNNYQLQEATIHFNYVED